MLGESALSRYSGFPASSLGSGTFVLPRLPTSTASPFPQLRNRWHNESGCLFVSAAGDPLSSNGITKTPNRIGQQHRGKPFGSSILRHSYLSHKYGKESKEKSKDADVMGHSLSTQSDYVKTD